MNVPGLFVDYQRVITVVYSFSGMISLHIERNHFLMSKGQTAWSLKSYTRGSRSAIHVCTIGEAVIFHLVQKTNIYESRKVMPDSEMLGGRVIHGLCLKNQVDR